MGSENLTVPLRMFGGLSRADVNALKELWSPVTFASDLRAFGNHAVGLIDAAGEVAIIEFSVPRFGVVSGNYIYLVHIGVANLVGMKLDVGIDMGADLEQSNIHTSLVTYNFNTAAGEIGLLAIALPALEGPGDLVGVRCFYNIGPVATNIRIVGVIYGWL